MNAATHTRSAAIRPAGMTVLYDAGCPVCRRARRWVERHRQLVPVRFVAAGSPLAIERFPGLDVGSTLVDVTAITDQGAVLRGDRAWIAVLWSVARTRALAVDLANGRRTRMFRQVKGATDTIRRFAGTQADPGDTLRKGPEWPPPLSASDDNICTNCRT